MSEDDSAARGAASVVWARAEPRERPALAPLSRDRIVRAAITLADADGLEAVSLRKVAAALDAGPMRLYGYLSTKEELLDLMADAVYGEIAAPEPGRDWRKTLRDVAHATRSAALRHPWFADLMGGRPHLGPNALRHLEASLAALAAAPVPGGIDAVVAMRDSVNAYVIGAVRNEITERHAERVTGMDEQEWQSASMAYLTDMLASGRFPTLARVVAEAADRDAESRFSAGLEFLLDGIAVRLRD